MKEKKAKAAAKKEKNGGGGSSGKGESRARPLFSSGICLCFRSFERTMEEPKASTLDSRAKRGRPRPRGEKTKAYLEKLFELVEMQKEKQR